MSRTIPPSLAPILEHLELNQPETVTPADIRAILDDLERDQQPERVIHELAKRGWLIDTDRKGVWEFAEARRAGSYSKNDPFLTFRAEHQENPDLPAVVSLGSAMWLHDRADRVPDPPDLSIPSNTYVPAALKRNYHICRFSMKLPPVHLRDVPVQPFASILVNMAEKPAGVRDWSDALEWLPDLVKQIDTDNLKTELSDRSQAAKVRLAYLLSGLAPDLIEELDIQPGSVVRFGPREKPLRSDDKWNVVDSLLPYPPSRLGEENT